MTTHRISVDIDEEDHRYLKLCCVKLGVSIKSFVVKSVIEKIDEQEDQWWLEKPETQALLKESAEGTLKTVPFEDVAKELGICV